MATAPAIVVTARILPIRRFELRVAGTIYHCVAVGARTRVAGYGADERWTAVDVMSTGHRATGFSFREARRALRLWLVRLHWPRRVPPLSWEELNGVRVANPAVDAVARVTEALVKAEVQAITHRDGFSIRRRD